MDIARVQREFAEAQKTFSVVELRPTTEGTVSVRAVLQTGVGTYVIAVKFPDTYPNEMPRVYVDAPAISTAAPHRYNAGNICYLHPTMWNPGIHHLTFVIGRAAKWLSKYEVWRTRGKWPGAEIKH
jgi:ubiquitin-protein ligase